MQWLSLGNLGMGRVSFKGGKKINVELRTVPLVGVGLFCSVEINQGVYWFSFKKEGKKHNNLVHTSRNVESYQCSSQKKKKNTNVLSFTSYRKKKGYE